MLGYNLKIFRFL